MPVRGEWIGVAYVVSIGVVWAVCPTVGATDGTADGFAIALLVTKHFGPFRRVLFVQRVAAFWIVFS